MVRMILFDVLLPKEPRQVQTLPWLISIVKDLSALMQPTLTLLVVVIAPWEIQQQLRDGPNCCHSV